MSNIPEGKVNYNFDYNDWYTFKEFTARHLELNADVDDETVDVITNNILRFNSEDKEIPIEERQPIIIYVNSPGGELTSGISCIDSILLSKTPIYTVNICMAASMAFLIFLAGNKRYSFPHSEFLMHDGNVGYFGDSTGKARDRFEFTNSTEQMIKDFVIDHSKISEEIYEKMYRKEWYMYPEEAKENGFVDYIIGVDCDLDEIV